MAKKLKQNHKVRTQFIEYLVSGGVYFWVGYLLLNYLYYRVHWSLWWATIVSNVIGWSVNFALQRYWAFNNKLLAKHQTEVTTRYIIITLVDFLLNYFILYALNLVGITPAIGQFISSTFFTGWNYFWYRFWVFPEKLAKKKKVVTTYRIVIHRAHGHSAYVRIK
jgi:putative flippase GtrA